MGKQKIIITGGSGFIGTNLVEHYKDNYEVLNIDIVSPRNNAHKIYWEKIDILDNEHLVEAFKEFRPDFLFHMAARTDLEGKTLDDYNANIQGVKNIIIAIKSCNTIRQTIFASSRLVCKIGYNPIDEFDYKPSTIYGESKIIGEKIVRGAEGLDNNWVVVRPTSLWGPWFDIPYKNFFDSIKRKVYVHPRGKAIHKKFGYVGNCIHILDALLLNKRLNTKTLYLSDFEMLEVKQWADLISQQFHNKQAKTAPYFVLKILAFLGDILKTLGLKSPPITSFRLNNLMTHMDYDTSNVEQLVGKLPYSLSEGTAITYNWYTTHN
jgi:nucleoside-diphosphate-sugar epimerase